MYRTASRITLALLVLTTLGRSSVVADPPRPLTAESSDATVIVQERAKLVGSPGGALDAFGTAVDLAGDWLAVGCGDAGVTAGVYLFQRRPGGWAERVHVVAPDTDRDNRFGFAVSLSDERLAVGAPLADQPGLADVGAVYVFERGGGIAKVEASDGEASAQFGRSVELVGETLFVGSEGVAPFDNVGHVYVFERDGESGEWAEAQKLTLPDAAPFDDFGEALAAEGDTLLVGAPGREQENGFNAGAVYVFEQDTNGLWTMTAELVDSVDGDNDSFGEAVSLSGSTALIGAGGSFDFAGAAFVFDREADGTWSEASTLTGQLGTVDGFGDAVALAGDLAVVGARASDDQAGRSTVFHRQADGPDAWGSVVDLVASDGEAGDLLGTALATDGETLVAGATGDDDRCPDHFEDCDSGAVYVYGRD